MLEVCSWVFRHFAYQGIVGEGISFRRNIGGGSCIGYDRSGRQHTEVPSYFTTGIFGFDVRNVVVVEDVIGGWENAMV